MFNNLMNFDYQRTFKEAIGFYIAYLILIALVGALGAMMTSVITGNDTYALGFKVGNFLAPIICLLLGILIIYKKKNVNFMSIVLILISSMAAVFFGGLGGLILISYLTTRPAN